MAYENRNKIETAAEAARHMRIGWNIGNSLDSCGAGHPKDWPISKYETQWKNPVISRELICLIKEIGYQTVRIPVTWYEHMDENGNIELAWLERVREVVDYVLEENMYCIINVHHDTGGGSQAWLRADRKIFEQVKKRYGIMWQQIAEYFRDYGERLLFEGFNEMLDAASSWDYTDQEGYEIINQYHQLFVDVVRKTGGNNQERNLLLNTYGASPMEPAASAFRLPEDGAQEHLLVGVHFYKPDAFTAGNMNHWGAEGEVEVQEFFERMDRYFGSKGIPVVMGECGTHDVRTEKERIKYIQSVITKAIAHGMVYFWWDDGGNMKLIDREQNCVIYQDLQREIIDAGGGK